MCFTEAHQTIARQLPAASKGQGIFGAGVQIGLAGMDNFERVEALASLRLSLTPISSSASMNPWQSKASTDTQTGRPSTKSSEPAGWLGWIRSIFSQDSSKGKGKPSLVGRAPYTVFVRIEESIAPLQRGIKYEDPLNKALGDSRLGFVAGGGSVQGTTGEIEWASLDLQLVDAEDAVVFVQEQLRQLGAPKGSCLRIRKPSGVSVVPVWSY
jgi:hypothetical protein